MGCGLLIAQDKIGNRETGMMKGCGGDAKFAMRVTTDLAIHYLSNIGDLPKFSSDPTQYGENV